MGNITFLGVEGSGKTVLTMALVNAFKAHEHEGWFLRPETRGAFRFLEQVPTELKEGTLPHQTTSLRHLAWSVVKDGEHQQTLDVLDYPGEVYRLAFLNAEDEADPEAFRARVQAHQAEIKALLGHLFQSEHIFVLFNIADSRDLAGNAKNLDAVWVTNACLDYLHRLPHKPRITLLLTQIDKYVDLEQYELDPKVYYTRHLPLIAHNFPQLDVCAVAALGAADATFGIDSILVRSLFKTPMLQEMLHKVARVRGEFNARLESFSITDKNEFQQLFTCLKQLSADNDYWRTELPWFIKTEDFCGLNGLVPKEEAYECLMIMRNLYVECYVNRQFVNPIQVYEFLSRQTAETTMADELLGYLSALVEQAKTVKPRVISSTPQQRGAAKSKPSGKLIALIVGVCIVGVLIALFATLIRSGFEEARDEARVATTLTTINIISQACDIHRMKTGRVPRSLEELGYGMDDGEALITGPLVDAWDKPFEYQVVGRRYTIRSAGKDGVMNTEDDLTN